MNVTARLTGRRRSRVLRRENQRLADQNTVLRERIAALEYERTRDQLCPAIRNRRGFDLAAADLAARTQDNDTTDYWVGIVDLDDFKDVNDRFGHAVGDCVIQATSGTLLNLFAHSSDRTIVARLGGDEFGFLTNGTGLDALNIAHYAHMLTVTAEPATCNGLLDQPVTVTMSIGVAAFHPWAPWSMLKHAADCAMYEAKQMHGTGSLVIHTALDGVAVDARPTSRIRDQRHAHPVPLHA
ncbi:GGDEF domain-containing protein [Glycomyces sp. A-F 0318]|uniref:GGDEF domain-containing protein n=1 Tax=Glycomyces amatae TaxID=2881355 RepID=UPI001E411863|nr:GGDEF domain-containing protein [Glycomyces amatae]MCD0446434.1 GGDEF domain-containing protein [Glycomyces amatae]